MTAQHLFSYEDPVSEKHVKEVCRILDKDGIIAYPTDVNWAFACRFDSKKGMQNILALKPDHPKKQPFSLLCDSLSMVAKYSYLESHHYKLLKRILPGAYTVVVAINKNLPRSVRDGKKTVGVRIPQRPLITSVISHLDAPLVTSSLPLGPDGDPLKFGFQVHELFGHALDLVLDLGEELPGLETTVLDLTQPEPEVLREGAGPVDVY